MRKKPLGSLGCNGIIFIIILLIIVYNYYDDVNRSEKKQKREEQLEKTKSLYINKFDFDLNNIEKNLGDYTLTKKQNLTPKKPIIIFQKRKTKNKNTFSFYYDLNKKLEGQFMSFFKDKIQTIVIVSDTSLNVGNYSRTNKIAFKQNVIITYIDNKTKEVILKDIIVGEDPPQEIRYREKDNYNEVYGERPNESEILERIKSKIK